jgi:sortase A
MRVLRAEPKTRGKPTAPFSVDPANLLALYAIRLHQPRVDLSEVPLTWPATDLVDGARKRAAADLAKYPVRRVPDDSASRRRAKTLLRWTQRLLLLSGLLLIGTWGWFYAEATVFQAYQGWRLGQLVKHRPAELKTLVESRLAKIGIEVTSGSPPPAAVPAPTKSLPPSPQPPPPLVEGTLIGRVEIPRLALSAVVLEGDSNQVLRKAAGHIPGTALPGRAGNVAIAGHRDTFFRALRNVRKDDVIALETIASTYHYRVDSTDIVAPKDIRVLKPSDQPSLTLVTCYPFSYVGSAPERYIVHARQIESSPTASSGPQPKPLPQAQSQAPANSPRQARSAHQAKPAHQVARRFATPRRSNRPAAPSSDRRASTPLGNGEGVAAPALSVPPVDAHKPGGLRRRVLAIPKRFASWLRSHSNRTTASG